ncbi:hypothetical protein ACYBSK_15690 [Streptomyces sp. BYX5S]
MFATVSAVRFLARAAAGLFVALVPAVLITSGHGGLAVVCCVPLSFLVCSALARPLAAERCGRGAQCAGLTALLASLSVPALTGGTAAWPDLAAAVLAGSGHGLALAGADAALRAPTPLASHLGFVLPIGATALLTAACSAATATTLVASALALLVFPATGAALETGRNVRRPVPPLHWIDPHRLYGNPTRSSAQF